MDTKAQKEELMKVLCPSTYQAYQWLKLNRNRFTGYIYGPVMIEINCHNSVKREIESVIESDLMSFICENSNDMNLFLRTVRDNMKLQINVCLAPKNCHLPVRENFPYDDHMSVLLEKVVGPDPVLNYLCKNYNLHDKDMNNEFEQSLSTDLQLDAALNPTEFNNDYEAGCSTSCPSGSNPLHSQLNIPDLKKDEAAETQA
ncbi:structural maintenance of chromosomes protein 5-like [Macrosteles quadrilineatus]|uniref:structural maintenance of chromosomes protein 5-like n=1 Tax=Macrosteles quadrilineatus TaxID=74068 RepID=UPI0023E14389|nr:structural maintenance of chromosomes protein 5-like [Macrosteles quadrilineatus]